MCSTSNDKAVTNLVKTLMGKERLERIKIFAGDIVEKKKPNPDIYDLAKVCVRACGGDYHAIGTILPFASHGNNRRQSDRSIHGRFGAAFFDE